MSANDKTTLTYRILSEEEQPRALPLLGRCFKEAWENIALTCKKFPIYELSFAAFDGETIVGHVGLIPYTVSDGKGGKFLMGGIGSVATDPDYRGRGIASGLCKSVIEWCGSHPEYRSLPLYTGKDRVYESVGWRSYVSEKPMRVKLAAPGAGALPWTTAKGVSAAGQARIRELYDNGEDFCGKVLRGMANGIQDWPRFFREAEFTYVLSGGIYALLTDNAAVEIYCDPGTTDDELMDFLLRLPCRQEDGTMDLALPRQGRIAKMLRARNHDITDCPRDLMHGEHPMVFDLTRPGFHDLPESVFYPLGDKF